MVRTDSDVLMQDQPNRTTQKTSVESAAAAALDEGDHSEAGTAELKAFLDRVGASKLLAKFIAEGIDMECISALTDKDLQELGLDQMGPRKKFLLAAAEEKSAAVRLSSHC